MALFRNVLKKGDTWSELYVDTCSDTSDDCVNEIMAVSIISPQLAYVHNCDFLQCFLLVSFHFISFISHSIDLIQMWN